MISFNSVECYIFQANVCHAYNLLRANGIPKHRIITFMYDDIAYNPEYVIFIVLPNYSYRICSILILAYML